MITPDVVEYDRKTMDKPEFDLILGTKTLNELGIILNFKQQMITLDEIKLPMRSINQLPQSRKKALTLAIAWLRVKSQKALSKQLIVQFEF